MRQLIYILVCLQIAVTLTAQNNYDDAIKQAKKCMGDAQYDCAIIKYWSAEAFNPSKKEAIKDSIGQVFKKIQELRKTAERALNDAQKNLIKALNSDQENEELITLLQAKTVTLIQEKKISDSLRVKAFQALHMLEEQERQRDSLQNEANKALQKLLISELIQSGKSLTEAKRLLPAGKILTKALNKIDSSEFRTLFQNERNIISRYKIKVDSISNVENKFNEYISQGDSYRRAAGVYYIDAYKSYDEALKLSYDDDYAQRKKSETAAEVEQCSLGSCENMGENGREKAYWTLAQISHIEENNIVTTKRLRDVVKYNAFYNFPSAPQRLKQLFDSLYLESIRLEFEVYLNSVLINDEVTLMNTGTGASGDWPLKEKDHIFHGFGAEFTYRPSKYLRIGIQPEAQFASLSFNSEINSPLQDSIFISPIYFQTLFTGYYNFSHHLLRRDPAPLRMELKFGVGFRVISDASNQGGFALRSYPIAHIGLKFKYRISDKKRLYFSFEPKYEFGPTSFKPGIFRDRTDNIEGQYDVKGFAFRLGFSFNFGG